MALGILGIACLIGLVASAGVGLGTGSWLLALLAYSATGVVTVFAALGTAALSAMLPARADTPASAARRPATG